MTTLDAAVVGAGARTARERAYWTAWAATVTFFAGFYALLVPLPRYLAGVGLPDWQVGLVLGAFGVASLVGRPLAGVASDRFGPRRVMLVGAGCLAAGALGVVATASGSLLFALRVLQATGYVAFTTAGTALVVSLVAPEERGRRLAVFGAAANLAITLTPAAIAALLDLASNSSAAPGGASVGGVQPVATSGVGVSALPLGIAPELMPVALGLLISAVLAVAAGGLAATIAAPPDRALAGRAVTWAVPRRLWLPMTTAALLGAGFASFFQFAPILAERRGGIPVGLLYTVYGVGIIATRFAAGSLLDRLPIGRVIALASTLLAIGLAAVAATTNLPVLLLAALVIALGSGLFHPALIAHHAALLPEAPGRATAAFYVGFDLGLGAGSWLYGFVLELAGVGALYWTAAAIVAAVVPLSRWLGQPDAGRMVEEAR